MNQNLRNFRLVRPLIKMTGCVHARVVVLCKCECVPTRFAGDAKVRHSESL